jgi:integrase
MALQMARPFKHPKTQIYYFRQRVPTDLRRLLGDKIISWSLRTKDPDQAKVLNAAAVMKQAMVWERHRKQPEPLPHAQIVALSGILYRDVMAALELEPGEPSIWRAVLALLDRVAAAPDGLSRWYGSEADRLLLEQGLVTDDHSRKRLLEELDSALRQAAEQQLKRASGDYRPDPDAARFPSPDGVKRVATKVGEDGPSIRALFKLWERDHLAEGKAIKTVADFRQKIEALIAYLGHDDAQRVTPENIADWVDYLRHEHLPKLTARTVGQKYLTAAKLTFGTGVAKRKLKVDPTISVSVAFKKPKKTRSSGFTDDEARIILTAALCDPAALGGRSEENKRAIRWGPWVCAFTGARIAEIMQLRKEDLQFEVVEGERVPFLRITPEAGSVKTGNYRLVPIHPQLQSMGLVEMIEARPAGPLFFTMDFKRKAADPHARAKNAGTKILVWIREGLKITDTRIQPNHAWRHRFKTVARDVDIPTEYSDAITGHEDGRAASDYGETTIKVLWREIQKLPKWNIEKP